MAYDLKLADRVRNYLAQFPELKIEEKKMFRGLAFIVNEKMCVNVSGDNLMCRFDPELTQQVMAKKNVRPMIMKGRKYKGYCYVEPAGFKRKQELEYWIMLCLEYNHRARSSKK